MGDLFVDRRRPATDRNVEVAESARFGSLALGIDFVTPTAKIDNGTNTELFGFGEPLVRRLRAAKVKVVYFACVGNFRKCKFLRGGGNVR